MHNSIQVAITVILALLLAHLLGDFPFQTTWIAKNKGKRFGALLWHGVIHLVISWACLLLFTDVTFLSWLNQSLIVAAVALHLVIDKTRHVLSSRQFLRESPVLFITDQSLHLVTVILVSTFLTGVSIRALIQSVALGPDLKIRILETATIYAAVVFGGGYFIRSVTKGLAINVGSKDSVQVKNAGLFIGWIERTLVITAIAVQSPALVGLILTAKSIARLPEFKEVHFAEYFLIGTMLSILIALLGGLLLLHLLYGSVSLK